MSANEPRSRYKGILARAGILLAALGLFLLLRLDVVAQAWPAAGSYVVNSARRLRSPSVIEDYLNQHSVRKLQIGSGGASKQGWLNTDIEPSAGQAYLDAAAPFPLPDRSFTYIFSEHVIEHLSYEQGLGMLKESCRVLAPGGRIRVATPNLLRFIDMFNPDRSPETRNYVLGKPGWHGWPSTPDPETYILNMQMHEWGHRFMYTPKLLRASLEAAGFRDIQQFEAGVSDDPAFKGIEVRATSSVKELNRYETQVFEAVKPH